MADLKESKTMESTESTFPYEHSDSWTVNAGYRLQIIPQKREGCYQI